MTGGPRGIRSISQANGETRVRSTRTVESGGGVSKVQAASTERACSSYSARVVKWPLRLPGIAALGKVITAEAAVDELRIRRPRRGADAAVDAVRRPRGA